MQEEMIINSRTTNNGAAKTLGSLLTRIRALKCVRRGMTKHVVGFLILVSFFGVWAGAQDRKLLALASVSYATALYDMHTTMNALKNCRSGCGEANPLMRPF